MDYRNMDVELVEYATRYNVEQFLCVRDRLAISPADVQPSCAVACTQKPAH